MAVNRIRYRDGRKICIPIQTREEYIALRDSKFNADCVEKARKGDKKAKAQLEQFNYSLVPPQQPLASNGEFPLKGANCVGNSVGMDVDFDEAEIGKIPEVVERILAKKDEIGLLMLEKSATKGLHLVFKRKPELSQEGNLKSVSETLNVPFDEGAKDITRVFFTPTSKDLLFIDEEMFDRTPQPPEGERVYRHETVRGKSMAPLEQKSVSKNHPLGGRGPRKIQLDRLRFVCEGSWLEPRCS